MGRCVRLSVSRRPRLSKYRPQNEPERIPTNRPGTRTARHPHRQAGRGTTGAPEGAGTGTQAALYGFVTQPAAGFIMRRTNYDEREILPVGSVVPLARPAPLIAPSVRQVPRPRLVLPSPAAEKIVADVAAL